MYVGCQNFGFTQTELEFLVRHGVSHIDANHGLAKPLTLESLLEARQAAADRGVNLEMIHVLPGTPHLHFLSPTHFSMQQ